MPVQNEALLQGADGVATAAGWGQLGLAYTGDQGQLPLAPSVRGLLETARARHAALQGAGCCSCIPAPCVTPRLASGDGHRRTCARKEPVEPSRWMTRLAEPGRGHVAGSTWSLELPSPPQLPSPSHAAAAVCGRRHTGAAMLEP